MAEIPDWLKDFELEQMLDEIIAEKSQSAEVDQLLMKMFTAFTPEECDCICSLINMLAKKLNVPEYDLMRVIAEYHLNRDPS